MCISVCIYVCVSLFIYIFMCVSLCVCVSVCVSLYVCACMDVCRGVGGGGEGGGGGACSSPVLKVNIENTIFRNVFHVRCCDLHLLFDLCIFLLFFSAQMLVWSCQI